MIGVWGKGVNNVVLITPLATSEGYFIWFTTIFDTYIIGFEPMLKNLKGWGGEEMDRGGGGWGGGKETN